jgi:hypothetical protein
MKQGDLINNTSEPVFKYALERQVTDILKAKGASDKEALKALEQLNSLKAKAVEDFSVTRHEKNAEIKKLVDTYWTNPEVRKKYIDAAAKDIYRAEQTGYKMADMPQSFTDKKATAALARTEALSDYNKVLNNIKQEVFQAKPYRSDVGGFYSSGTNTTYLSEGLQSPLQVSVGLHELGSHAALKVTDLMPSAMQKGFTEGVWPNANKVQDLSSITDDFTRLTASETNRPYYTTPEEIHARILQTRLHSGKFPQGELT